MRRPGSLVRRRIGCARLGWSRYRISGRHHCTSRSSCPHKAAVRPSNPSTCPRDCRRPRRRPRGRRPRGAAAAGRCPRRSPTPDPHSDPVCEAPFLAMDPHQAAHRCRGRTPPRYRGNRRHRRTEHRSVTQHNSGGQSRSTQRASDRTYARPVNTGDGAEPRPRLGVRIDYRFGTPSCFTVLSAFSTSRNTCEMSAPLADAPLSAPSWGLGANMPVTI
jgi:hypothetical protein